MFELLGISSQALFGQLLIGLINGSFYALLSLGLAVIFGMLNIINFTHGAQYMLGAFAAYFLLLYAGLGYWWAIIIAPIVVGITGIIIERLFLQWLYKLDHLYGLLLTFGLALIFEGTFRKCSGSAGLRSSLPPPAHGAQGGHPGSEALPVPAQEGQPGGCHVRITCNFPLDWDESWRSVCAAALSSPASDAGSPGCAGRR